MPHLAGKCDCGRNIHFPKNAPLGYQWECRNCGKTWTLSTRGKPLHNQRSKAPPRSLGSASSSGCSQIIGFALIALIGYIVFLAIN